MWVWTGGIGVSFLRIPLLLMQCCQMRRVLSGSLESFVSGAVGVFGVKSYAMYVLTHRSCFFSLLHANVLTYLFSSCTTRPLCFQKSYMHVSTAYFQESEASSSSSSSWSRSGRLDTLMLPGVTCSSISHSPSNLRITRNPHHYHAN